MGGGDVPDELLSQLHPLEVRVVAHLRDGITLSELSRKAGVQEVEATRACQWLENKKAIETKPLVATETTLGLNGAAVLKKGSFPEQRFLAAAKEGKKDAKAIAKAAGLDAQEVAVSIGVLKRHGLIDVKGTEIALTEKGRKVDPSKWADLDLLRKIQSGAALTKGEQEMVRALRERKEYLTVRERKDRLITLTDLGKRLAKTDMSKLSFAERLTPEDLASGAWKEKRYRAYDVSVNVPRKPYGKEHFVQEAIDAIRRIWIEMGFSEMQGTMVHSAFWDLDALFVPQDHPAREMQDTFYLKYPERAQVERHAFDRVRDAHENGGNTGSLGWRAPFSRAQSERLLMRTHTTVLSAQTLWAIREGKAQMPGKYFTVGKVFRNEKLDWKHLFEFHQVEGIVVDKSVTFGHLISYLRTFFSKMGYPKVRLRPSHFPYTEPSVEVEVWHPKRNQWVELGGAGIFRPEVTKTLIGEEVPVLAWGLGLERIIVDYFSLDDLRDLYGNDVKQLQEMRRFARVDSW